MYMEDVIGKAVMIEPKDQEILTDFLTSVCEQQPPETGTPGDIVLRAGRYFLDAPYGAHTLEAPGPEALVVNLRRFDCFTLVENCCALALLVRQIIVNNRAECHRQPAGTNEGASKDNGFRPERGIPAPRQGHPATPAVISSSERSEGAHPGPLPSVHSPAALATYFTALLRTLRYRDGVIASYPSRLHYFSDWLANNARQGLLRDMTTALGGRPTPKVIDFMTKHRELYPSLQDETPYSQLQEIEAQISALPRHVLPKEEIADWEGKIAPGDILAVATHEEGLDVTHAGIAIRSTGHHLHLLHASSEAEKVIVSPETLATYLQKRENRAGIIVARLI